ncbi:MAG: hypothetical protein EZS28_030413, partial [Streblomastix strix]
MQALLQLELKEKPKKGRGSKKAKTEGLNASVEQNQGNNAKAQTKIASKVPKTKAAPQRSKKAAEEVKPEPKKTQTMREKRRRIPDRAGTLQTREISVEISVWNRGEERADDNSSSGEGGKDWRIDIQREDGRNGGKDQKIQ